MHSGLIILTLLSITLIIIMITCFICFINSRRKEDEELMSQVQYSQQQQQQQQQQQHLQQQQHQQQQPLNSPQYQISNNPQAIGSQMTPQRQKMSPSPSNNLMINDITRQQQPFCQPRDQIIAGYQQARNDPYGPDVSVPSPYHSPSGAQLAAGACQRNDTRTDITQQINSAVIGSSEAEFQNDFIQVFPMYQIAPQPEKNTTPYLT